MDESGDDLSNESSENGNESEEKYDDCGLELEEVYEIAGNIKKWNCFKDLDHDIEIDSVKKYVETIDEHFLCSVCSKVYECPKVLPCQHTFCKDPCMRQLLDDDKRKITCYECKDVHELPEGGVESLKSNFILQKILDARDQLSDKLLPEPTVLSRQQLDMLENYFRINEYTDVTRRKMLRQKLNLNASRIKDWFKKRRHEAENALAEYVRSEKL